ncbi:MAG: type II toxin-antitoxin system VapC family toxin [Burkholderiales bacterium]
MSSDRWPAPAPPRRLIVAEPPAAYLIRPPLVVDCSLIAALLFQEPERDEAQARLFGRSLHAPALIDFEIVSVAVKKLKRGESAVVAEGIARLDVFPIERHEVDPAETLKLAMKYQITGYDAAYLWLAAELRAPLATFDRQLATAAQAHLSALR